MKVRMDELSIGSCFLMGRKKTVGKKVDDDRVTVIGRNGKARSRRNRGNPQVEPLPTCPLPYIGLGARTHPDEVVEIGDGRPRRYRNPRRENP